MTVSSTHKGDQGFTNLLSGERVRKDHPIVELVGEVDELAAWIGIARSELGEKSNKIDDILEQLQGQRSLVMAYISSSQSEQPYLLPAAPTYLSIVEDWIAAIEAQINVPNVFLKAGKTKLGAYFNLLRVISRRMERKAVVLFAEKDKDTSQILPYLNRLSTLFYVLWLFADQKLD
jgi:cob(I)alamin adenosyltransferase